MADIFLSYSREDRPLVQPLADQLAAEGFAVWWDRQLAGGSRFLEETERELMQAKAVVVVWTRTSIASAWVADEAAVGRDAGKLVPISLDGSVPPLGFRQFQVIDFADWRSNPAQMGDLLASLKRLTSHREASALPQATTTSPQQAGSKSATPKPRSPLRVLAAAAGVMLLVAAIWGGMRAFGPKPLVAVSQRVGIFGFTASDGNPASSKIAADTTDQAFSEFTRLRIDTAAKSDSLGVSTTDRLDRARTLGAAYALSGEVGVEGDQARIVVRLEDPATRTTLWETTEVSPVARPFFSPPRQAAFRAARTIACVVDARAELSQQSPERISLIIAYCADFADLEGQLRAIQSLAKLEPNSAFFQALSALHLIYTGDLPAAMRAERVSAADALITETMRRMPGDPLVVAVAEYVRSARGISPREAEELLSTAKGGGSSWAQGNLLFRRGVEFLGNGRTEEGIARLKAAEAARPVFMLSPPTRAHALASLGQAADAEVMFEQTFARSPDAVLNWPYWVRASVLENVGDPIAVISAAPKSASQANVACWRAVLAAKRASKPGPASDSLRNCGFSSSVSALAALGRVDEAFSAYRALPDRQTPEARMLLFAPSARLMRANPSFLPLAKELGLWDYWIATGSHPDLCDLPSERDFDSCAKLRAAQAK